MAKRAAAVAAIVAAAQTVVPAAAARGKRLLVLPANCAADSFISAQLNWPAAVARACPAAPLHRHRAACRFGHSSLRDLRVLKEGRLAAGCSVAGRYVASYSVAGM